MITVDDYPMLAAEFASPSIILRDDNDIHNIYSDKMAAPMDWDCNNSQNPRFNHRNFSQAARNRQQHIQRFNTRIPPPVIPHQGFNRPFNPGFNFNAIQRPITHQTHGTNNVPGSNFRSQDMPHFQGKPEEWQESIPCMPKNSQLTFHQGNFQPGIQELNEQDSLKNTNNPNQQTYLNSTFDVRNNDEAWMKKWCEKRSTMSDEQTNKQNKSLKIWEAQDKTRRMIVLLARLQKNKQMLETLKDEDKSVWGQKLKEVQTLKINQLHMQFGCRPIDAAAKLELESLQNEVMSDKSVKLLKQKIERRKKKRERIKQRQQILYQEKTKQLADREMKHAEIDKTMQQIIQKQSLEKQEKDMQKEADEILSQVRKKQSESNKYLQIVNSLQKLRKLRTDRLERQGVLSMYESRGNTSAGKLMFEAKVSNISQLLNTQLDIYKNEEAALKVHLETEHEETREKEREKNRLIMIERQKQNRKKEEQMLFGVQREPVPGDPVFPFRQYYNSACHDLNNLISIRREWDQYLSLPGTGSCIPDEWVMPSEPSSDAWASVLK